MIERSPDIEAQEPRPASCKTCSNWFDKDFFKSVINPKDIFCPFTLKKSLWFAGSALALGGVITAEVLTGAFSTAANYNNIGLMVALYAVDPVMQSINIIAAQYPAAIKPPTVATLIEPACERHKPESPRHSPYASEDETVYDYMVPEDPPIVTTLDLEIAANRERNKEVDIVIPTHLAADKIEFTIQSLLIHVKPEQIYILDNGNNDVPQDNTREIVRRIHPDIHYVWGFKGNKSYAQLVGTLFANNRKFIYTSDDDMRVPRYFSFGTEHITNNIKAVCYAILGVHPEPGKTNWLIRAQSLEYVLSDCAKLAQQRFGSVLYPHGAASLWEKHTFLRVIRQHSAIFYAEDVQLGMLLQRLGYAMAIEAGTCLETVVPETLFGGNPNLVQQRGRSWEMGRQSNFFKFAYQLFCVLPPTPSPLNFIMHKLAEAYAVYTNIVDWIRLPLFLIMMRNPDYWLRLAILIGAGYVPLLGWNYIKLPLNDRRDLQVSFLDIAIFPLFKLLESALSIYGIGRLLSVYGPNYTHKPSVSEFEQSFRKNPMELAREIELERQNPALPPHTYKTIMYGKFFKQARTHEEINREFEENCHYVDFMVLP